MQMNEFMEANPDLAEDAEAERGELQEQSETQHAHLNKKYVNHFKHTHTQWHTLTHDAVLQRKIWMGDEPQEDCTPVSDNQQATS